MKWITGHKLIWRIAMLALLLAALIGPWIIDNLYVPRQYECNPPTIRLEGDFCGVKLSGLWIIRFFVPAVFQMSGMLVSGKAVLSDIGGEFLYCTLLSLLVLPFFSTILVILREGRRRLVFHMAAWSVALGVGLMFGLSTYPKLYWVLWGNWVYSVIAAMALIAEVMMLAARRKGEASTL